MDLNANLKLEIKTTISKRTSDRTRQNRRDGEEPNGAAAGLRARDDRTIWKIEKAVDTPMKIR